MKTQRYREKFNNILLGFLLCANMLVDALASIISIGSLFPVFVFLVGVLFVIGNYSTIKLKGDGWLFFAIMFLQSLLGVCFIDNVTARQYFFCFILIGIPSILVGLQKIDVYLITKTIVLSGVFTIWHPISIIVKGMFFFDPGEQMGVAYSFLPLLFSSIVLLFSTQDRKRYNIFAVVMLIVSLAVILMQMTRGALLAVLVFLVVFCLLKIDRKSSGFKFFFFLSMLLLVLALFLLVSPYITSSNWYFTVFKQKEDDIFNGRLILYEKALIWQSFTAFLFGNGCGSFQEIYAFNQIAYPHNLLLQIYFEQGVLVFLWMIVLIFKSLFVFWRNDISIQTKIFLAFLLSASIIRLSFSYYFWIDPIFWVYTSYIFKLKR